MKIKLPAHDSLGLLRIFVKMPGHPDQPDTQMSVAREYHSEIEITLPEGVEESDVDVSAEWVDNASKPVGEPMVLAERTVALPQTDPQPIPDEFDRHNTHEDVDESVEPVEATSWQDLELDDELGDEIEDAIEDEETTCGPPNLVMDEDEPED